MKSTFQLPLTGRRLIENSFILLIGDGWKIAHGEMENFKTLPLTDDESDDFKNQNSSSKVEIFTDDDMWLHRFELVTDRLIIHKFRALNSVVRIAVWTVDVATLDSLSNYLFINSVPKFAYWSSSWIVQLKPINYESDWLFSNLIIINWFFRWWWHILWISIFWSDNGRYANWSTSQLDSWFNQWPCMLNVSAALFTPTTATTTTTTATTCENPRGIGIMHGDDAWRCCNYSCLFNVCYEFMRLLATFFEWVFHCVRLGRRLVVEPRAASFPTSSTVAVEDAISCRCLYKKIQFLAFWQLL